MTIEQHQTFLDNVLGWLHKGYPEGVPPKDYYPLLALLKRSLSEDEVVQAAQTILRETDFDTPVTAEGVDPRDDREFWAKYHVEAELLGLGEAISSHSVRITITPTTLLTTLST